MKHCVFVVFNDLVKPAGQPGVPAESGKHLQPETVDHVLTYSRGGRSTWLNLVTACFKCNQHKAGCTPEEAGTQLLVTPYVPRHAITLS